MRQQDPGRFPYDLAAITRNAPPMSGVYAIFSRSECVYVGESDDVCASLLEIYYEYNPCLDEKYLSHFSFDLVAPEVRAARRLARIRELRPVCNLRTGSPNCRGCRSPQGEEPGALLAAHGASGHPSMEATAPARPVGVQWHL